ncbi:hypothetical protein ACFOX1_11265, partial [Mariniflexile soesokkakense]
MKTKLTIKIPLLIYKFTVKKLFENKLFVSLSLISIMTLWSCSLFGQRYMENLDRGLIAMRTNTNSVLISWRIPGDEYTQNATYNLYRGSTLIASNLSVS